ncbi:MAG TPA: hypothetical protein VFO14_04360 [Vicinamibacterales bacterium]|nr:hypothetical protein [Vicinamibacterales bacterium]
MKPGAGRAVEREASGGAPRALDKVRQAAITREIIEVVSGAEAL